MIFKFKGTLTKISAGIIKIPTLVGLTILLIGLAGGVYLVTQNQTLKSKAAVSFQPKNINIANLNDTSATIYWQSDEATSGFIQAWIGSQDKSVYRDDRDPSSPESHKLHFVTLTKLQPNTTYFYQIHSGSVTFPEQPASFKTIATTQTLDWSPLVGTIIDTNNQAVDEVIITLDLPETHKLATITKTGGNFILPLAEVKVADLTSPPSPNTTYAAKLNVLGTLKTAQATILLPPQDVALPPVVLGSNVDLTKQEKPVPQITPKISSISAGINKYDINGDGVVNFTDLSIVLQNFGPTANSKNPKADLNGDGVIDQKDSNLLLTQLK